jgi:hypothetical protein
MLASDRIQRQRERDQAERLENDPGIMVPKQHVSGLPSLRRSHHQERNEACKRCHASDATDNRQPTCESISRHLSSPTSVAHMDLFIGLTAYSASMSNKFRFKPIHDGIED